MNIVSDKVAGHSLAYLSVQKKCFVGDVPLYNVCRMSSSTLQRGLSAIAELLVFNVLKERSADCNMDTGDIMVAKTTGLCSIYLLPVYYFRTSLISDINQQVLGNIVWSALVGVFTLRMLSS